MVMKRCEASAVWLLEAAIFGCSWIIIGLCLWNKMNVNSTTSDTEIVIKLNLILWVSEPEN